MGTCFGDGNVFYKFKLVKMRRERIYKNAFFIFQTHCSHRSLIVKSQQNKFELVTRQLIDFVTLLFAGFCWAGSTLWTFPLPKRSRSSPSFGSRKRSLKRKLPSPWQLRTATAPGKQLPWQPRQLPAIKPPRTRSGHYLSFFLFPFCEKIIDLPRANQ